ncbi:putative hydrolase YxeP [Variibacter gotjawalensis]|uniref:Putative hydrolase YxeP n=1 Tax=Variibacter gotjawalensis TaxID=1333996 RepID=A0A0S3PXL3_9BRAD|nr:M20 aminoacylase family protein [Variibacter gotjawalensis]NIK46484.1 hippurate hydrolase [Variibacter gotjawalensis]RZS48392.1 hippurate hydrolase [Variibacter gotjawalensis]BAT60651.1 putative hydrolase YxeP [Variibacter gotjawalensis]
MPILNRISDFQDELTAFRRDLHQHPEILFDTHRTSAAVTEQLKAFGCDEVVGGIGRTGVVGVIKGRKGSSNKVIGLRADMDALPLQEITKLPYASKTDGKMHACGHDGHTTMLLGAAKYLAETRNFDGTAIVIFQPAEEGGGGGREMVKDGLMERFGIQEVYGMHNWPGFPVGSFAIKPGPVMAAADRIVIDIEGRGAHAAKPHEGIDALLIGSQIVNQIQSIVSRNADPLGSAVVSITQFHAGTADNIIPQTAQLRGTARTLSPEIRDLVEDRLTLIVENTAKMYGGSAKLTYRRDYPVTVNNPERAAFAAGVAKDIAGDANVNDNVNATMGAEDFSFMLNERPGAYIFIGNGDSAGLHHPAYDFNDQAIPFGSSYWVRLVEKALPA